MIVVRKLLRSFKTALLETSTKPWMSLKQTKSATKSWKPSSNSWKIDLWLSDSLLIIELGNFASKPIQIGFEQEKEMKWNRMKKKK